MVVSRYVVSTYGPPGSPASPKPLWVKDLRQVGYGKSWTTSQGVFAIVMAE